MADSHLKNIDRRPKRRRDKDNPYTIFTTGINTATPHYYLSFVDCGREKRCIEIDTYRARIFLHFRATRLT